MSCTICKCSNIVRWCADICGWSAEQVFVTSYSLALAVKCVQFNVNAASSSVAMVRAGVFYISHLAPRTVKGAEVHPPSRLDIH